VLVTAPAAPALTVTTSVKVAVAPEASAVVLVAVTTPAAGPVTFQPAGGVSDTNVVFAGRMSVSVAPVTGVTPRLATRMVYVIFWPATAVVAPSVLNTLKSVVALVVATTVSVSVDESLAGFASMP